MDLLLYHGCDHSHHCHCHRGLALHQWTPKAWLQLSRQQPKFRGGDSATIAIFSSDYQMKEECTLAWLATIHPSLVLRLLVELLLQIFGKMVYELDHSPHSLLRTAQCLS